MRGRPAERRSRARRSILLAALVLALGAIGIAAIVLSPLLLIQLNDLGGINWSRLSEIGQTYSAASAILATFAPVAVAISLFVQIRQVRASQIHVVRELHGELMRMALEDPNLYFASWGPAWVASVPNLRQHLYTNLVMNYFHMAYEVGIYGEPVIRRFVAGMFEKLMSAAATGACRGLPGLRKQKEIDAGSGYFASLMMSTKRLSRQDDRCA